MNESPYQALIYNAALLLALAFLFDVIVNHVTIRKMSVWQIPLGIVIGAIGIGIMDTPWILIPGIIFDTRSILLGITGLFFGLIPTLIAIIMTAAFRIFQGGAATIMGVAVIISSGMIGVIWRHTNKTRFTDKTFLELYGFGIIIHLVMLSMALLLPWQTAKKVLDDISAPVMIIYPVGTALLGILMVNRYRKEQTTEALENSEVRLRLAVETGNIGLYDRNLITNYLSISPEWKNQLGYEENELEDNNVEWEIRLHPDDKDAVHTRLNAYIEGKSPFYEAEFRLLHKDGTYRWILSRGVIDKGGNGRADHLIGTHIDITRQKEFADSLQKSEQRFRGLAESSMDYIMLYDREFRPLYMNTAAMKFIGCTESTVIGKSHYEAGLNNNQSDILENDIRKVFATGESSQRLFDWKSAEGKAHLDWRLSPVMGIDGNVDLVLGISRDITATRETEIKLQKSREQYKVLTESMKDVVWILDTEDLKFKYISPSIERLRGFTVEEVMSQPLSAVLIEGEYTLLFKQIQGRANAFIKGTESPDRFYTDEIAQPCKDGSIVWTEAVMNFYQNKESGHLELRGVSRDISERKRTEEIMSHAQYELHRMLKEADQSRHALLSVAEDQKLAQEALAKTAQDLMEAYDATLQGWSTALEMRERETAGHCQRVVHYTLELARSMGIDDDEMIHIQRGALLHDIGKMGIPDSILLKPGPLSEDEWMIMRQHPTYAHRLLSSIPYLLPALDIPYYHHERWDGSGYPKGLAGEDIPLIARIFAVVDVWDALSSDRPYRPAWTTEVVLKYLRDQSGKQFDPKVVEKFLEIYHDCSKNNTRS
jgi:PAS domain S-box-containing protein